MEILGAITGQNQSAAFQAQPPYTFCDGQNVVAREPGQGRLRLGTRQGFLRYSPTAGGSPVRLLERLFVKTNDKYDMWSDSFAGTSLAHWSVPSELIGAVRPSAAGGLAYATAGTAALSVPSAALVTFNSATTFRFGIFLVPYRRQYDATFSLYFGMATGNDADDSHRLAFTIDEDGDYSAQFITRAAGADTPVDSAATGDDVTCMPGWLEVEVNGTSAKCYWRGTLIKTVTLGSAVDLTKPGLAFALGPDSVRAQVDRVRVQYYRTGNFDRQRPRLIYSQGGTLYYESYIGQFNASATSMSLASDRRVLSAVLQQLVYIADHSEPVAYGTDGVLGATSFDSGTFTNWTTVAGLNAYDYTVHILTAGDAQGSYPITAVGTGFLTVTNPDSKTGSTLEYRIERAPKIYNIVTDTLTQYTATTGRGMVPVGCSIFVPYRGRIVAFGDPLDPNEGYASRMGDTRDWLFSDADVGAAFKFSLSTEAGSLRGGVIAAAPYSDQYMLIWGPTSTYRMSGDIQAGGSLDCVSYTIGCVSRTAWCHGSKGAELFFLSRDGVYKTNVDCPSCDIISVSREMLPRELNDFSPDAYEIGMGYDVRNRWVHIYLTPKSFSTVPAGSRHYILDLQTGGFLPFTIDLSGMNPTAVLSHQAIDAEDDGVLTGGFGGGLYEMSWRAEDDCGTLIDWNVLLGPFNLLRGGDFAMLTDLCGRIASDSAPIYWDLYGGMTAEDAVIAVTDGSTPFASGTFEAGPPRFDYPRLTAAAFVMKLSGDGSGRRAVFESATANLAAAGMGRA